MTKPYLDFTFLIRLVLRTQGTRLASRTLSSFKPPFLLNDLLVLQVENFLEQATIREPESTALVRHGRAFWEREFSELVFQSQSVDWSAACHEAIRLNRGANAWPGTPLALLHLAAALQVEATHLLSFDIRQRALARKSGLVVLPEVLS